jgi:predicted Ser/Thr protein kinase
MEFLAKGKRSMVYREGNIVVKVEREDSQAVNRIQNEAFWLKELNKKGIGPKFLKLEGNKVFMEYIDGEKILDYAEKATKKELKKVLFDMLEQCRTMDKMQVNKLEMNHPMKHVLVRKNKVIMIDFERCKRTENPKNVTQVCQFLSRYFKIEGIIEKAKGYKEDFSENSYKEIKKCLTNTL